MNLKALLTTAALGAACTLSGAQITLDSVGNFDSPIFVTNAGDGSGRLFVNEQDGSIRIIDDNGDTLSAAFLNIEGRVSTGGERGLLGLAFHPDYENNGKFYVNYTDNSGDTVVSEFEVSGFNDDLADDTTERVLLEIDQPFSNHNGGWIGFGPDGYLYISTGDGGSAGDPGNRSADLSELLGKMHRIDVDSQDPGLEYGIPDSNPFADDGDASTRGEIWHYGLRNAWRCSFDRDNGDLWMADVGQNSREEVNHNIGNTGGEFYGWRCREGFQPFASCGETGWTDPVHDYSHSQGCSITGGYVYRGCELGEAFQGLYFFSDFCNGQIWTLDPNNGYALNLETNAGFGITSYGEGEDGELYLTRGNTVYKLTNPSAPDNNGDGTPDACESACTGDLDGNGSVGFEDLNVFTAAFSSGDPIGDLSGNGSVGFEDLNLFVAAFGQGCP